MADDADHDRISESYVNGTIIFVALGHPINPGNVTFFERHKNFNQAGYEIYRFFVHTPQRRDHLLQSPEQQRRPGRSIPTER